MNRLPATRPRVTCAFARGFSLVELMVALLISSLLLLGMVNVFSGNRAAQRTQAQLAEIQNNGRIGMNWLKYDLRMAGNSGRTYSRSPILMTTVPALQPAIIGNCFTTATQAFDWALAILPNTNGEASPMVFGVDDASLAAGDATFAGCIDLGEIQAGSDILSVHYASPNVVPDDALVNGLIYLNSGLGGAVLFRCNADGLACKANLTDARNDTSGSTNHRIVSRAYYVRSWSNVQGDGVPALVRVSLQGDGNVTQEVLISGVSSMQVSYGMDTDNDGVADRYMTAADMPPLNSVQGIGSAWIKIKTVRLAMLFQSTTADAARGGGVQAFDLGGVNVELPREYAGKIFSTTVAVRNPSARAIR